MRAERLPRDPRTDPAGPGRGGLPHQPTHSLGTHPGTRGRGRTVRGGPPGTGGEQLVAAGLGVAGAAGGLVWASGQLAGLAFGQAWLDLSAHDVASLLWQLPHHLDDPRQAWPAAARTELPAAAGMYASFAAATLGATAAAGELLRRSDHQPDRQDRGQGWASRRELRRLLTRRPAKGRVVLGRAKGLAGRLLAAEDSHSVLIYGPPGSFKTAGIVIPAILEWSGPLVSTSVKTDVLHATIAHRRAKGEVWVYDPLGTSGLPSAQWTPLAGCGTYPAALATAYFLAQAGELGSVASADHQYWTRAGVKFLAPMLLAAAATDRAMGDVLRWVNQRDEEQIAKILADLGDDGAYRAFEATHLEPTERRLDSLFATAEDLLGVYEDDRVAASTEGCDIDPAALLSGSNTLYLYAPPHEQRRLRPLFETLTSQVVRTAQEQAARSPRGMLDPRLLLALDEAGNIAALADLPELATTGRGQGIQVLSVWHDEAQLRRRYGDSALTVLNGHRAKVFLSGLADPGALGHGSNLIGDHPVHLVNPSVGPDGQPSYSQSTTWRPLVAPDQLRRLRPREGIVIYGHHRPAAIRLRPHFEAREQRRRAREQRRADRAARHHQPRDRSRLRRANRDRERQRGDGDQTREERGDAL